MSSKRTRNKAQEQEVTLTVFTNTMQDEAAYQVLQMFYKGAVSNEIGMMRALNNDTHEEELLLVGMTINENGGIDTYPLARCLNHTELDKYFSPDGLGGWYDKGAPAEPAPMDFPTENLMEIENVPTTSH